MSLSSFTPTSALPDNIYQQYMYNYPHKTAYRPIHADLRDHFSKLKTTDNTLYIHLPFCETKCGYCNLFTIAGKKSSYYDQYIDALERQAIAYAPHLQGVTFQNLILGGGTPLILNTDQLARVFNIVQNCLKIDLASLNTVVETAPRQTTAEKLALLKSFHVNRLSIGVESFINSELRSIFRFHSEAESDTAIELILKHQFDVVNLDFIYGMPTQTPESVLYSIQKAVAYGAQEIFVYPLYVKEYTGIHKRIDKDQPRQYELYQHIRAYLLQAGYAQTSMRCFVKSTENLATSTQHQHCGFANTLSLGAGARSYINELHFCDPFAVKQVACRKIIDDYIDRSDFFTLKNGFILDDHEQKRIFVIKNLLHVQGIQAAVYQHHFKSSLLDDFPIFQEWIARGYVICEQALHPAVTRYHLSELGLSLSDHLGPALISPQVQQRMSEYWG